MDIALFRKFVCDITDCRDEKNAQRDFQRAENVYKYFLASQDQTKSGKLGWVTIPMSWGTKPLVQDEVLSEADKTPDVVDDLTTKIGEILGYHDYDKLNELWKYLYSVGIGTRPKITSKEITEFSEQYFPEYQWVIRSAVKNFIKKYDLLVDD